MEAALHPQPEDKHSGGDVRTELVLLSPHTTEDYTESLSDDVRYWAPFADSLAASLADGPAEAAPFLEALASLISERANKEKAANLIECLAAHPSKEVRTWAATHVDRALNSGSEQAFRTTLNLVKDDEVAEEALLTISSLESSISAAGIKRAMEALSTHWWERRQGLHQQFREVAGRDPVL